MRWQTSNSCDEEVGLWGGFTNHVWSQTKSDKMELLLSRSEFVQEIDQISSNLTDRSDIIHSTVIVGCRGKFFPINGNKVAILIFQVCCIQEKKF